MKIGIKSTALRFGANTKPVLSVFTLAQLSLLTLTGLTLDAGVPFFLGIAAAGGLQGWMIYDTDLDDKMSCGVWFRRNMWTGGLIWLGCLGEWMCRMGGLGLGE